MGLSRRKFTKEFKLAAVRRLEQGASVAEVVRAMEVNPNVLHRWRREFREAPGNVFPGNGKQRWSEGRVAELERKIGQQALEIDGDESSLNNSSPILSSPATLRPRRQTSCRTNRSFDLGSPSTWSNWRARSR